MSAASAAGCWGCIDSVLRVGVFVDAIGRPLDSGLARVRDERESHAGGGNSDPSSSPSGRNCVARSPPRPYTLVRNSLWGRVLVWCLGASHRPSARRGGDGEADAAVGAWVTGEGDVGEPPRGVASLPSNGRAGESWATRMASGPECLSGVDRARDRRWRVASGDSQELLAEPGSRCTRFL